MILFPAIDLIAGQVVRLRQGDRSQMDVYATDPVAVARDFAARGARWIHVVDLSATFGEDEDALSKNAAAIRGICQVEGISVDTGGGVRDMAAIERLAEAGAKRIALGTALVRDPGFALEAAERYGDLLVADVAAKGGQVRVNGWREGEAFAADELVARLHALGAENVILTGVSYSEGHTGVLVFENGVKQYYEHVQIAGGIHGTGDIYASAFVGAKLQGKTAFEAAKIAADYVVECILESKKDPDHTYGARFEPVLGKLIAML